MTLSDYQNRFLAYLFSAQEPPPLPNIDVYRLGVEAKAVRALGHRYPTVKALLGASGFSDLVLGYLRVFGKRSGNWFDFGDELPAWVGHQAVSQQAPYLAGVAQLDWLVAKVERSAYDDVDYGSFSEALGNLDTCVLVLNSAIEFFESGYPVVSIWGAHRNEHARETPEFVQARSMLARGEGQNALILRSGWRGVAESVSDRDLGLLRRLTGHQSLSRAVDESVLLGPDFSGWLQGMIAKKVIVGVRHLH